MNYKFDGSRVFFTSDTHFNHTNIIRFCNRPFKDVSHMNETIIANWNRVVGPEDIVFHLGDFCLGGSAEWINVLKRLNGKIYLISGNHDIKNLRQNYTKYFEQITMQMYIEVDKQKIYLNHYPFLCYGGSYDDTWQLFGYPKEQYRKGCISAEYASSDIIWCRSGQQRFHTGFICTSESNHRKTDWAIKERRTVRWRYNTWVICTWSSRKTADTWKIMNCL